MESLRIRREDSRSLRDRSTIRSVIEAAFGGTEEADLVDSLRGEEHSLLSLVAEIDSVIVGHILFSRMSIATPAGLVPAVALAPLAVQPDRQRQGVGGKLVQHGLDLLRSGPEKIVIVAGHPDYYPKFGFSAKKAKDLESPFPPEAYMVLELSTGALDGIQGKVVYPPAFGLTE